MQAPPPVCVDASLVAAMLLDEPTGPRARHLWDTWVAEERPLISATQFAAEAISAIRRARFRQRVSAHQASAAVVAFLQQVLPDVRVVPGDADTWQRAWQWAEELNRAAVYDTIYLAVAEAAGAEFWTADENLHRALDAGGRPAPEWVHLVTP